MCRSHPRAPLFFTRTVSFMRGECHLDSEQVAFLTSALSHLNEELFSSTKAQACTWLQPQILLSKTSAYKKRILHRTSNQAIINGSALRILHLRLGTYLCQILCLLVFSFTHSNGLEQIEYTFFIRLNYSLSLAGSINASTYGNNFLTFGIIFPPASIAIRHYYITLQF